MRVVVAVLLAWCACSVIVCAFISWGARALKGRDATHDA